MLGRWRPGTLHWACVSGNRHVLLTKPLSPGPPMTYLLIEKTKKWEWTATASLQKQKFKRTRPLFPATLGRITRIQAVVIINLPFIILNNYLDINCEIIFQKNLNVIYKLMRNNFIAKLWKYLLVLFFLFFFQINLWLVSSYYFLCKIL
jgi:hypothetical protein